jgi:hypothetical protein
MKLLLAALSSGTQGGIEINGAPTSFVDGKINLATSGVYNLSAGTARPMFFKVWGAGGGSSGLGGSNSGGRGGYAEGFIQLQPNTTYKIVVGGPGQTGTTAGGAAGGSPGGGGSAPGARGSGGGYSGVFLGTETHANSLLIAGGAGGGVGPNNTAGGNGGGTTGGSGPNNGFGSSGDGGTQTAGGLGPGGAGGSSGITGSALTGAPGSGSGGGGGGYYGGGSGSAGAFNTPAGGNGGGGSGYLHPTLVTGGQLLRLAEAGGAVPKSTDPDYISPAGTQAAGATQGTFAGSGLVVIKDGYLILDITASGPLQPDTTRVFTATTFSPTVTWSSPNLYGGITLTSTGTITIPSDVSTGIITIVATSFTALTFSKNFFIGALSAAYHDESNYNLTMTPASGVTLVSTERPFSDVFSAYFSSTTGTLGTYGIIIDNAVLALGTGDFCVELWAKSSATLNVNAGLISGTTLAAATGGANIARDYQWTGTSNAPTSITSTIATHPFGWSHVAFVRSGTTLRTFVNGIQVGSTTGTIRNLLSTKYAIAQRYAGGSSSGSQNWVWQGWMTNIRIVKGYSVYSGNFAIPTQPLAQNGALSALAYPGTQNVDTTWPESACVFLTNFRN